MKSHTTVVAICLLAGVSLHAQTGSLSAQRDTVQMPDATSRMAKEADIRQLLGLTGAGNLASQTMDQMEKDLRPLVSNALPPGDYREKLVDLFFERFRAKRDPAQLIAIVVPIYDKYYSDEEIKGLIKFYESPLGKKMAAALPQIMSESQAAGGKWGQELGRESMLEVLAEHPDLRRALEQAKATVPPR
jgi:hypothetical protein